MGKAAENNIVENTAAEGTQVPEKVPFFKKLWNGIWKRRHIIGGIAAFAAGVIGTILLGKAREEYLPQLHDGWDEDVYLPPEGEEEEEDEDEDEEDEEPPAEE